jgi:hypothetical protein
VVNRLGRFRKSERLSSFDLTTVNGLRQRTVSAIPLTQNCVLSDNGRYTALPEIDPPWAAARASARHLSGSPLADNFLLLTRDTSGYAVTSFAPECVTHGRLSTPKLWLGFLYGERALASPGVWIGLTVGIPEPGAEAHEHVHLIPGAADQRPSHLARRSGFAARMASDGTRLAGRSFAPSNVAVAIGPVGLGGWSGRSARCQSRMWRQWQGPALRERHAYGLHRLNAANP